MRKNMEYPLHRVINNVRTSTQTSITTARSAKKVASMQTTFVFTIMLLLHFFSNSTKFELRFNYEIFSSVEQLNSFHVPWHQSTGRTEQNSKLHGNAKCNHAYQLKKEKKTHINFGVRRGPTHSLDIRLSSTGFLFTHLCHSRVYIVWKMQAK